MDVWSPQVDDKKQHPNFVRALADSMGPCRETISSWANGFSDRDGKFVKEFQTTFNSSFWELYLHACFRELGIVAGLPDRPDFILDCNAQGVWVEATVAQHPDGAVPEWQGQLDPDGMREFDMEVLLEMASVRLANSLSTKHRKFMDSYRTLPGGGDVPFVIALAPFEQPLFWLQRHNAICRVLYAYDAPISTFDPVKEVHYVYGHGWTNDVAKPSGTVVPFGFFQDDRYKEISAVIFSSSATWGKVRALSRAAPNTHFCATRYNDHGPDAHTILEPGGQYAESLMDGLHILLNPHATHPLPLESFSGREIAIHTQLPGAAMMDSDIPHGFLFERMVYSFTSGPEAQELRSRIQRLPYTQRVSPWPEGKLHEMQARTGIYSVNYLAHYKGQTLLVTLDPIDRDWGGMSVPGLFRTVPRFVAANNATDAGEALGAFCETKEEALAMLCRSIDEGLPSSDSKK